MRSAPRDLPHRPLAPGELRVCYAFTSALQDRQRRARCLDLLSEAERARQLRFRFERDQDSYLLAHALCRRMLSEALHAPALDLTFEDGPRGRPELAGVHAASRVRFNISHTEGLVACALALEHDVGVDVEHVDRRVEIAELSRTVFSEVERSALLALAGEHEQRTRFFELWTLKEAYIKAVGMGLALPLCEITFELHAQSPPRVAFGPRIADNGERWYLNVGPRGPRHMLAMALGAAPASVTVTELDPGAS